jgi:ArsR family transcriptional regulator, arsenate/arsenite/antimonite-responsive transcriptional repressor
VRDLLFIAQALSDESRVRILFALRGGERCVCQIVELLDLAPSTVSRHLTVLKHAALVEARKEGRWLFYRLAGKDAPPMIRKSLRWLFDSLETNPRIAADATRLRTILQLEPEVLCCRQREAACA